MFTGIIETIGRILSLQGGRLEIENPWNGEKTAIGQSVAVDGCCLTVVEVKETSVFFDVSPETLARTSLGSKPAGSPINLERGLKLGNSIDGHLVTGHIDGVATVRNIEIVAGGNRITWFDIPADLNRWLVEKGSVAIDGVSLTVNELDGKGFSVMLIPHTLKVTSLGARKAGDRVNIEFDLLGKYVERMLRVSGRLGEEARG